MEGTGNLIPNMDVLQGTFEETSEVLTGTFNKQIMKGYSAYQVAVKNGFQGTQEEWLSSLKGQKGDQGIQGIQGEHGIQGIPGNNVDVNIINRPGEHEISFDNKVDDIKRVVIQDGKTPEVNAAAANGGTQVSFSIEGTQVQRIFVPDGASSTIMN